MHSTVTGRALADNESGGGRIHASDNNLHVLESPFGRKMFRNAFPVEPPKQIQAVPRQCFYAGLFPIGRTVGGHNWLSRLCPLDHLLMQASGVAISQQSLME